VTATGKNVVTREEPDSGGVRREMLAGVGFEALRNVVRVIPAQAKRGVPFVGTERTRSQNPPPASRIVGSRRGGPIM